MSRNKMQLGINASRSSQQTGQVFQPGGGAGYFVPTMNPEAARANYFAPTQIPQMRPGRRWQTVRPTAQPGGTSLQSMPGGTVRPGPRPGAGTEGAGGPGAQQQMRPSAMNARPITGQSTAQARTGMTMPQSSMPGRPQQTQAPTMPQSARPGFSQFQNKRPQQQSQAIVVPGQDALTVSMLAAAPPQEQKQMLGERLFPLIQRMYPDLACKLAAMLLEIDNSDLLYMLESSEFMIAMVEEAVAVLQAHEAKEAAASQAATNAMKKE